MLKYNFLRLAFYMPWISLLFACASAAKTADLRRRRHTCCFYKAQKQGLLLIWLLFQTSLTSHHPACTETFSIKPNNLYRSMSQLVLEINKHLLMCWDLMPHRFLRVIWFLWSCCVQTANHKLVCVVSSRSASEGPGWPSEQEEMFGIPGSSPSCQVVPGKWWISSFKRHRLEINQQVQSNFNMNICLFFHGPLWRHVPTGCSPVWLSLGCWEIYVSGFPPPGGRCLDG